MCFSPFRWFRLEWCSSRHLALPAGPNASTEWVGGRGRERDSTAIKSHTFRHSLQCVRAHMLTQVARKWARHTNTKPRVIIKQIILPNKSNLPKSLLFNTTLPVDNSSTVTGVSGIVSSQGKIMKICAVNIRKLVQCVLKPCLFGTGQLLGFRYYCFHLPPNSPSKPFHTLDTALP